MKVNEYKVKWRYETDITELEDNAIQVKLLTTCSIQDEDGDELSYGETIMNPLDTYNKDVARKKSLERALQGFPKNERGSFWEVYRNLTAIPRW